MSLILLNFGSDAKIIREYIKEGYKLALPYQKDLVGKILNLKWVPDEEDRCGGVILITKLESGHYYGQQALYRGGKSGDEFQLPDIFYYDELSERQS